MTPQGNGHRPHAAADGGILSIREELENIRYVARRLNRPAPMTSVEQKNMGHLLDTTADALEEWAADCARRLADLARGDGDGNPSDGGPQGKA